MLPLLPQKLRDMIYEHLFDDVTQQRAWHEITRASKITREDATPILMRHLHLKLLYRHWTEFAWHRQPRSFLELQAIPNNRVGHKSLRTARIRLDDILALASLRNMLCCQGLSLCSLGAPHHLNVNIESGDDGVKRAQAYPTSSSLHLGLDWQGRRVQFPMEIRALLPSESSEGTAISPRGQTEVYFSHAKLGYSSTCCHIEGVPANFLANSVAS